MLQPTVIANAKSVTVNERSTRVAMVRRGVGSTAATLTPSDFRSFPNGSGDEGDDVLGLGADRSESHQARCARGHDRLLHLGDALLRDAARDLGHRERQEAARAGANPALARAVHFERWSAEDLSEHRTRRVVNAEPATELTGIVIANDLFSDLAKATDFFRG